MSQGPATRPPAFRIRNPREFVGGLAFIAFAAFAYFLASDLPAQTSFRFTPGTLPRILCGALAVFGLALVVVGMVRDGPAVPYLSLRGPLFVCGALVLFALILQPLGLIIACFLLFVVAAMGTPDVRWLETIIGATVMTVLSALLFVRLLGLPFKLYPW